MEAEVTRSTQVLATKISKLLDQELARRDRAKQPRVTTLSILSFVLLYNLGALYDEMLAIPAEREQALELLWDAFKLTRLDAPHDAEPAATTTH